MEKIYIDSEQSISVFEIIKKMCHLIIYGTISLAIW